MRAGLEIGVYSRAASGITGLFECDRFRMADTVVGVKAFANAPVFFDNDCTDHRAWAGKAEALLSQF